jgi:predicted metal-binding protein
MENKTYIAVVQCQIVKQRCSGYFCEKAFNERTGGFKIYPKDKPYRIVYMDCGGCCGQAVLRKLNELTQNIQEEEKIGKDAIAVQLSSCITKDNYHSPPCPHLDYLKAVIKKQGLDIFEDTKIYKGSEQKRKKGIYKS